MASISHAAKGDIVTGAMPIPADTSDTASPRGGEPAHDRRHHRREKRGHRAARQHAETQLKQQHSVGAWPASHRLAANKTAPANTTGLRHTGPTARPRPSTSPPSPESDGHRPRNPGARPARRLGHRGQQHRQRKQRPHRHTAHQPARRHHDPAIRCLPSQSPFGNATAVS